MRHLKICELSGVCWPNAYYPDLKIDRSGRNVAEYLRDEGVEWTRDARDSDLFIRKAELTPLHLRAVDDEQKNQEALKDRNLLNLIGEPRNLSPVAYLFANSTNTLAVAPGKELDRMWFCSEWKDPELDTWSKREDRICWIGRPIENRIRVAQALINQGIPLDIFSREPWPVSAWKGPAEDDVKTAQKYRYRIVFENSVDALYHSEKVFTSIRSGCVTFYYCDPSFDLGFLKGSVLKFDIMALKNRGDFAPQTLEAMNDFMFTGAWEVYSPREFYRRIIDKAYAVLARRQPDNSKAKEKRV